MVGHGGAYVKHIQQETGCRVQIKGRGSGYIETATQRESDEPMFLHVAGPDPKMVEKARELCEDLLANVKEEYENFKSRPPRSFGHGGHQHDHQRGHGGHGGHIGHGNYRDGGHSHYGERHQNNGHSSYQHQGYGGDSSSGSLYSSVAGTPGVATGPSGASAATQAGQATSATDYAAQYAQYYGGADPYAAYGGYAA